VAGGGEGLGAAEADAAGAAGDECGFHGVLEKIGPFKALGAGSA
jgi:hypothetical protein